MKRNIGIWIDKKQAVIVSLKEDGHRLRTLESNLEFFHPKGGSRSKTRYGPQEVIKEKTYMEREKNQLKDYFTRITACIRKADSLALYGPCATPQKFREYLELHHPAISSRVDHIGKADSMTSNQFAALVRNYYTPATSY